jgi:hypothetical protein
MAFVQRFEKFIHKGTQKGVRFVKTTLIVKEMSSDIKMQGCKIGAGFNDEICIIHRIGYHKFVEFDVAFDGDFNGFVRTNSDTENFI